MMKIMSRTMLQLLVLFGLQQLIRASVRQDGSCELLSLIPFSDPATAYGWLAAAYLGMKHFNARKTAYHVDCPDVVFFSTPSIHDASNAVHAILKASQAAVLSRNSDALDQEVLPCAVWSVQDLPDIHALVESLDLPLAISTQEAVTRNCVGLGPAVRERVAPALSSYLLEELGITDMVVVSEERNEALSQVLEENDHLHVERLVVDGVFDDAAVDTLQTTGIRTIFLNVPRLEPYAVVLHERGMLTNEYFYILPSRADSTADHLHDTEAPLYQLLDGSMILSMADGFDRNPLIDPFLQAWLTLDQGDVAYLNHIQSFHQAPDNYFRTTPPVPGASFVYDTIMTIGWGACTSGVVFDSNDKAEDPFRDDDDGRLLEEEEEEEEKTMLSAMLDSAFLGASGPVRFPRNQHTREASDVTMGVWNVHRANTVVKGKSNIMDSRPPPTALQKTLVALYGSDARWKSEEGVAFQYRGGSTTAPLLSRVIHHESSLSLWARAIGFFVWTCAVVVSCATLYFLWQMRKLRRMQRSQPRAMTALCVGSLVMAMTIVTLAWDEEAGWTDHQLDMACTAAPWLFFAGDTLILMACFVKLWYLGLINRFRGRQDRFLHFPIFVFGAVVFSILLTWTLVDPWTWEREIVQQSPSISAGQCTSEHLWTYFGPLMGLAVTSRALLVWLGWKAGTGTEASRENSSIVTTLCIHLQAWIVGVPILAILENSNSVDATLLARIGFVGVLVLSSILLGVVAKLRRVHASSARDREAKRVTQKDINLAPTGENVELDNTADTSGVPSFVSTPVRKSSWRPSSISHFYGQNSTASSFSRSWGGGLSDPDSPTSRTTDDMTLSSTDITHYSPRDDKPLLPVLESHIESDGGSYDCRPIVPPEMPNFSSSSSSSSSDNDEGLSSPSIAAESTDPFDRQNDLMELIPRALHEERYEDALTFLNECLALLDENEASTSAVQFDKAYVYYHIATAFDGLDNTTSARTALNAAMDVATGSTPSTAPFTADSDSMLRLRKKLERQALMEAQTVEL